MQKKFGRQLVEAQTISANRLVLGGHCFTGDDLLCRSAPPVLVQSEPAPMAPARTDVDEHRRADDERRMAALETALVETRQTIELSRSVHLERTAVKRNRHWYVGGRRVNAADLQGDSRRYFSVVRHVSIASALQSLAEEIDALHGAQKLAASDESSSSTNN